MYESICPFSILLVGLFIPVLLFLHLLWLRKKSKKLENLLKESKIKCLLIIHQREIQVMKTIYDTVRDMTGIMETLDVPYSTSELSPKGFHDLDEKLDTLKELHSKPCSSSLTEKEILVFGADDHSLREMKKIIDTLEVLACSSEDFHKWYEYFNTFMEIQNQSSSSPTLESKETLVLKADNRKKDIEEITKILDELDSTCKPSFEDFRMWYEELKTLKELLNQPVTSPLAENIKGTLVLKVDDSVRKMKEVIETLDTPDTLDSTSEPSSGDYHTWYEELKTLKGLQSQPGSSPLLEAKENLVLGARDSTVGEMKAIVEALDTLDSTCEPSSEDFHKCYEELNTLKELQKQPRSSPLVEAKETLVLEGGDCSTREIIDIGDSTFEPSSEGFYVFDEKLDTMNELQNQPCGSPLGETEERHQLETEGVQQDTFYRPKPENQARVSWYDAAALLIEKM